jgi:hypothetical protein
VTKLLHEYALANRELFYNDKFNRKQRVELKW